MMQHPTHHQRQQRRMTTTQHSTSRLPVPVGRHPGHYLLVTAPSAQHNTTQHNTTQHNTTQHNTTQHNTTQHNTTQHNTTQRNATQHNTTQHNTTQHNTTQHNTTQHNTTQRETNVFAPSPNRRPAPAQQPSSAAAGACDSNAAYSRQQTAGTSTCAAWALTAEAAEFVMSSAAV